jgi:hypothetical protein
LRSAPAGAGGLIVEVDDHFAFRRCVIHDIYLNVRAGADEPGTGLDTYDPFLIL